MLEKDAHYSKLRSINMLERHPSLVESYRTILLDWLSEVSQECKFHRETYHLAQDFIDRYLTSQSNVGKLQLQLIGTTCLFLAAKYEEIRPPTVNEFADLTDGACQPEDIIDNEVVILNAINWEITPMTPNSWLNIYMQILLNLDKESDEDLSEANKGLKSRDVQTIVNNSETLADENSASYDGTYFRTRLAEKISNAQASTPMIAALPASSLATTKNDSFILPPTNGIFKSNHKRIASVIDLALLHIESLRYSNSILTASALYYFTDELTVRQCTGYSLNELADCIRWLKPFVETIKDIREPVFVASCKGEMNSTQMHSHIATAKLLEKVNNKIEEANELLLRQSLKRKTFLADDEITNEPVIVDPIMLSPTKPTTLLTPPKSTRKTRRVV